MRGGKHTAQKGTDENYQIPSKGNAPKRPHQLPLEPTSGFLLLFCFFLHTVIQRIKLLTHEPLGSKPPRHHSNVLSRLLSIQKAFKMSEKIHNDLHVDAPTVKE